MATSIQNRIKSNLDIIAAVGIIGVVIMMVIPLPTGLLDVLLTFNITISV